MGLIPVMMKRSLFLLAAGVFFSVTVRAAEWGSETGGGYGESSPSNQGVDTGSQPDEVSTQVNPYQETAPVDPQVGKPTVQPTGPAVQPGRRPSPTKLPAIPDVGVGAAAYGKPSTRIPTKQPVAGSDAALGANAARTSQRASPAWTGAAKKAPVEPVVGDESPAPQRRPVVGDEAPDTRSRLAGGDESPALPAGEGARPTVMLSQQTSAEKDLQDKARAADAARKAENLLKMRSYEDAVKEATLVLQSDPYNVEALLVLSEAFIRLRRYEEAKAAAARAEALKANNARVWSNKAWAEQRLGEFQDAVADVARAIQLDPRNAVNYAIRAYAKESLGDRDGALEDMKVAAQLDSRFEERLEAAQRGGKLYDPMMDDAYLLMDVVSAAHQSGSAQLVLKLLGVLFLLMGGGIVWLVLRKPTGTDKDGKGSWRSGLADAMDAKGATGPAAVGAPAGNDWLLGKYELIRPIGRGGMGDVYEGQDHTLNRTVAIKKLTERYSSLDPQAKERMVQEAKTVAAVHHPSIVQIYEVFSAGGALYLVFEFIKGKTVQQMLAESQTLPLDKTVEILGSVCQALSHAHKQGLVHRDIKPANIMVTEGGHVKLMDFGIARSLGAAPGAPAKAELFRSGTPTPVISSVQYARTATGAGTPLYSAPETESGIVSRQADVYSMGVCLYEMLTGRTPFPPPGTQAQKIQMDFLPPSLRVPELPQRVDDVVAAALQANPDLRMKTPEEFIQKLSGALPASPPGKTP
jgi:tetratricopeptide (TPR) repeat protein